MSTLFCCANVEPYRPQILDHEAKFTAFKTWAQFLRSATGSSGGDLDSTHRPWPYAIQLVRQVNYGALESKRYFVPKERPGESLTFDEITEKRLVDANFAKLNL